MVKKSLKYIKWFFLNWEEIVAVIALAIMLCAILFNVIMRYLFRNPTSWADELAMICMAYVTFVGGAVAYKKNLHFGIDFLVDKLPLKVRMFIRRFFNLVYIFLFGYATILGYRLFDTAVKRMIYSGWSYKIIDASMPLGFLSMTIYSIYFFYLSFKDKKAYEERYEQNYEADNVDMEAVKAGAEIFANDAKERSEEA